MTGQSHTDKEGKEFALKVMKALNDACAKWKAEEDIDMARAEAAMHRAIIRLNISSL